MIDFSEMKIGGNQARQFARAIYADIADYIKNHQEEYKQFLENKDNKGVN